MHATVFLASVPKVCSRLISWLLHVTAALAAFRFRGFGAQTTSVSSHSDVDGDESNPMWDDSDLQGLSLPLGTAARLQTGCVRFQEAIGCPLRGPVPAQMALRRNA